MRRLLPAVGLAIALLAAGCASSSDSSQAATVNGAQVSVSRLTDMVKAQLAASQNQQQQDPQQQQQSTDIDALTRSSLEGLIQFQVILDGAKKQGVSVDEGQVDARIQQVKDQAASQGMKYQDLLSQNNITERLLREQFRAQIALTLVGDKLVPQPSDADLLKNNLAKHRTDVIQIHVRHVLVKDQATAQKARNQLDPTIKQRRDAATEQWFTNLLKQANVSVNPRFGRWDAATGKVVERSTAPASPTSTAPPPTLPGQP